MIPKASFEALQSDKNPVFFLLKFFMKVSVRMDQEIQISCQLGGQCGVLRKGTLEVF